MDKDYVLEVRVYVDGQLEMSEVLATSTKPARLREEAPRHFRECYGHEPESMSWRNNSADIVLGDHTITYNVWPLPRLY